MGWHGLYKLWNDERPLKLRKCSMFSQRLLACYLMPSSLYCDLNHLSFIYIVTFMMLRSIHLPILMMKCIVLGLGFTYFLVFKVHYLYFLVVTSEPWSLNWSAICWLCVCVCVLLFKISIFLSSIHLASFFRVIL